MAANYTAQLRELEPEDIPTLNQWRNDREIIDLLGNNFFFIAQAIDEDWYQQHKSQRNQHVRLAITIKETGDYIGNVNLTSIHPINQSAEFSIMIGNKDYWSKGVGEQATRQMLQHAFADRGLHRIYLTVLTYNKAAIALYEKCGFENEGIAREAMYKNGAFHDVMQMGLLRDDYQPR